MATLLSTEKALNYAKKAESEQDWATAVSLYHSVLEQFPNNRRAKLGLKSARSKAVTDLLQRAKEAQTKHNWAQSQVQLEQAFELAPDVPEIGLALAQLQLENGEATSALDTANKILAQSKENADAASIRGMAFRDLERVRLNEILDSQNERAVIHCV